MQHTSSQSLNGSKVNEHHGHPQPPFLSSEPFGWDTLEDDDGNLSQVLGSLKRRALVIAGIVTIVMGGVT